MYDSVIWHHPRIGVLGLRSPKRSFKVSSIMYINLSFGRGRTLRSTSCISQISASILSLVDLPEQQVTLYKTSLRRVRRERLIAQTRSDQNREFTFCAATERAQVEQDDLPSRNTPGSMLSSLANYVNSWASHRIS